MTALKQLYLQSQPLNNRTNQLKNESMKLFSTSVTQKIFFVSLIILGSIVGAYGQVVFTNFTTPYTQDFNSLSNVGTSAPWTDNSTLPGWYSSGSDGVAFSSYHVGISASAGIHSYGSSGATDRALGMVSSSVDPTSTVYFGVRIVNNTGATISSLNLNFTAEQWRRNKVRRSLIFEYSNDPATTNLQTGLWTSDASFDFLAPRFGSSLGLNGNASAYRSEKNGVLEVTIPVGGELWLRWSMSGANAPGLAIDDLTITVNEAKKFYNKPSVSLNFLSSWGVNPDGSGSAPTSFAANDQLFVVKNGSNLTISGNWTVSGIGSKVRVGDGVANVMLTIPANFALDGTVEIYQNAHFFIRNTAIPEFAAIQPNSTVEFASNSTQVIPPGSYYNLVSSGTGTRVFAKHAAIAIGGTFTKGSNLYSTDSSIVYFNGQAPQTVPTFKFFDLYITNPTTVLLSDSVVYSGTLSITNGVATVVNRLISESSVVPESDSLHLIFPAGTVYKHKGDGGGIVRAKWHPTSTCEISGIINSSSLVNFGNQSLGVVRWACNFQTAATNLLLNSGEVLNIQKLLVDSTGSAGTGSLRFVSGGSPTVNIFDEFTINKGIVFGSFGAGGVMFNILNDLNVFAGVFNLKGGNNTTGTTTLNIFGNLNVVSPGVITQSNIKGSAYGLLVLNGTQTVNFNPSGLVLTRINLEFGPNKIVNLAGTLNLASNGNLTVKGTFDVGTQAVRGAAKIIVEPGGTLISRATNTTGIHKSNFQNTKGIDFNAGSKFVLAGAAMQYLPSYNVDKLEINNPSGVRLLKNAVITVAGDLVLTSGAISFTSVSTLVLDRLIVRDGVSTTGSINPANSIVHFRGATTQTVPNNVFTGSFKNLKIDNNSGVTFNQSVTITDSLILDKGLFSAPSFAMGNNSIVKLGNGALDTPGAYGSGVKVYFDGTADVNSGYEISPVSGAASQLILRGSGKYTLTANYTFDQLIVEANGNLDANNKTLSVVSNPMIYGMLRTTHPDGLAGTFADGGMVHIVPQIVQGSTVNFDATVAQSVDSVHYGNLLLNGGAKSIQGNIVVSGNLISSASSVTIPELITFNGNSDQQITLPNAAYNRLHINGNGNKTFTHTSSLLQDMTFGPGNGFINFGNDIFTLKSSSNGTASIGNVYSHWLIGSIKTENYVAGGRRAFRFLSHPFSTTKDLSLLIDDIDITGKKNSGFTPTTSNNPSAFKYENNNGWYAFTNINGPFPNDWKPGEAIRILIRGQKGQGLDGQPYTPDSVTLTKNGPVNYGPFTWNLTKGLAGGYNFLGNPYPSPINTNGVFDHPSIYGSAIWIWNPRNATQGAYEMRLVNEDFVLPMGAGIMVETNNNVSITVNETSKIHDTTNFVFKSTSPNQLIQLVFSSDNNKWNEVYILHKANSSDAKEPTDNGLMAGTDGDFFTLSSDNKVLGLDSRHLNGSTEIPLGYRVYEPRNFTLSVDRMTLPDSLMAYLVDTYTSTSTLLVPGTTYNFSINASTGGLQSANRFKIVFESVNILPISGIHLSGVKKENNVVLKWNVESEADVVSYEVQHAQNGKDFKAIVSVKEVSNDQKNQSYSFVHTNLSADNYYRIKTHQKDGKAVYSNIIRISSTPETNGRLVVYPNPVTDNRIQLQMNDVATGVYTIRIVDNRGAVVHQQQIQHNHNTNHQIMPSRTLSAGVYQLMVEGNGASLSSRIVVQ